MVEQMEKPGVAVITGAVGGMGSATANVLAGQGWSLILCDLDAGRLESLAGSLAEQGCHVEILAGDVSDPGFPERLGTLLADRPIGAVVHTAGLSPTMGEADRIFDVNYDATERLVGLIRPRMAEGSCAVLIASSAAYDAKSPELDAVIKAIPAGGSSSSLRAMTTNPGAAYSISKRGVHLIVEREAPAFGKRKARIMSISPGIIDTPMGRAEKEAHPIMQTMIDTTPLGRQGTSMEIATVAAFLCSPAASFVSGSDIKVDGGVLAVLHWQDK